MTGNNQKTQTMRKTTFVLVAAAVFAFVFHPVTAQSEDESPAESLQQEVQKTARTVRDACTKNPPSGTAVEYQGTPYLIMAWHSVDSFPKQMKRTYELGDGTNVKVKRLGYAPHIDTAVFEILSPTDADEIPAVKLADSYSVNPGDFVFTGGLASVMQLRQAENDPPNVSTGIVSSLHNRRGTGDMIGVDAAINYGDSGGGVFTMDGRYLGVIARMNSRLWSDENGENTWKGKYQHTGLGFCVPANTIKHFLKRIVKEEGKVMGGKYGDIKGLTFDSEYRGEGVRVGKLEDGSQASEAGFQKGDLIKKIGDRPVDRAKVAEGTISSYPLGTKLTFQVKRDGSEKTITAEVKMNRGGTSGESR